jgi:hypothetical protein
MKLVLLLGLVSLHQALSQNSTMAASHNPSQRLHATCSLSSAGHKTLQPIYGIHCGYRLRTRPRNLKYKAQFRASNEIDKAKSLSVYKQSTIEAKNILHTKRIIEFAFKASMKILLCKLVF